MHPGSDGTQDQAEAPAEHPNDLTVLAAAEALLSAGQVLEAERLLQPASLQPQLRAGALYLLAAAAVMRNDPSEALSRAADAVQVSPQDARCHFALGRARKLAGDVPQAIAAYRRAIALNRQYVEAHVSLGIALKHSGDLEGAIASYSAALAIKPDFAAAQVNMAYARAAVAEQQADQGSEELLGDDLVRQTQAAAEADPGNASVQFNLGLLFRRARRKDEAIGAFNRALGLAPKDPGYCLHLGHELVSVGKPEVAVVLFRRWQDQNPPTPAVMRALAENLARQGAVSEALYWGEKAVALDPDPIAHLQLCGTYQQSRRLEESEAAGRRAIAMSGRQWKMYSIPLMVANYLHEDPEPIIKWHLEFGQALTRSLPTDHKRPKATPLARRLRVGYVSADFIHHSVAFFMAPLLQHHDKDRFEVFCYFNRGFGDSMTEYLKGLGHHWFECEQLSDEALARRIAADGIDVLIDLAGHTAGNRIRVFGLAPAPLQLAYLGYPTVTGVQSIDYRVTDHTIDPGDFPSLPAEAPLRLDQSMFCYRPPSSPDVGPSPSLRNGYVTFGSFNNHAKISDHCLSLWAAVLRAVPGSRLLLKSASVSDPSNRAELVRFMASNGIDESRLDLRARIESRDGHLSLYNEIDLALDPFPYNGATTTCEALWMGVPVVTLAGRTHVSRMGASILKAAGLSTWIANSDTEYLNLAVAMASDESERSRWRQSARNRLPGSVLFDEPGFASKFETALLWAWDQQCAKVTEAAHAVSRA